MNPILWIMVLLMIFIGYLEDKFGFYRKEQEVINRRNPQINLILDKLEKIEDNHYLASLI